MSKHGREYLENRTKVDRGQLYVWEDNPLAADHR